MYADYYRLYATVATAKLSVFLRRQTGRDQYDRRGEWGTTAALLVLRVVVVVAAALSTVASALWPPRRAAHAKYFARIDAEHRAAFGLPPDDRRERFDRIH